MTLKYTYEASKARKEAIEKTSFFHTTKVMMWEVLNLRQAATMATRR